MMMILRLCLLVSVVSSLSILGLKEHVTKFGDKFLHSGIDTDQSYTQLVHLSNPIENEQTYKQTINTLIDIASDSQKQKDFIQCSKGSKAQFFKFGAMDVGFIGNKSQHESITLQPRDDDCFDKVLVSFTNRKKNAINTIQMEIFATGRRKQKCTQTYVFGTASRIHIHTFRIRKYHKFVWKNMNQIDYSNVVTWGIHIFRLCDSLTHWIPDVLKTVEVFVGGLGDKPKMPFFGSKPPRYMQRLNVDFIEAGTGFRWQQKQPIFLNLTKDDVKSGDFLAITRFDGIDQIIQFGAGSHSGHSAVVLEVDGVLSVVQSQDGWYWPKHGIQRNDWETWKKWALNADFNVAVLPLSPQSRKKFDVKKAQAFFKTMEGYPYGYHNFLFGWLDTPKDNYPSVLDPNFVLAMFSWLQRLYEYPIRRILTQGLNKRLGTTNKKLSQIGMIMAQRKMSFGQLMAMPQKDGWEYSDGPSYVCSSFVAAVYKAGGLLSDIQGTQMTPRDVYTLNIYDLNYKVPAKCKQSAPKLPYCQIMGRYLMELPGYATIQPYPHMAQKCPTMAPDFFRPDGC